MTTHAQQNMLQIQKCFKHRNAANTENMEVFPADTKSPEHSLDTHAVIVCDSWSYWSLVRVSSLHVYVVDFLLLLLLYSTHALIVTAAHVNQFYLKHPESLKTPVLVILTLINGGYLTVHAWPTVGYRLGYLCINNAYMIIMQAPQKSLKWLQNSTFSFCKVLQGAHAQ